MEVFNKLDQKEFKRRMGDSFPCVYLTVISIIQGVAMGILAVNTFGYIKDSQLPEPWVRFLPYSFMSFIVLIVVTYEYTWFIGTFKWSPKIWDTIVPFCLGISEISPMFYFTDISIWWLLTAFLCFAGAGGFLNTIHNCKESMFENTKAYERTTNALKWNISMSLIMAFYCLLAASVLSSRNHWYLEILFVIFLIAGVVLMIYKEERFLKDLHQDFGLIR